MVLYSNAMQYQNMEVFGSHLLQVTVSPWTT